KAHNLLNGGHATDQSRRAVLDLNRAAVSLAAANPGQESSPAQSNPIQSKFQRPGLLEHLNWSSSRPKQKPTTQLCLKKGLEKKSGPVVSVL
ncbi:hypothetical protein ACJ72_08079, partial [Emergomyces africanus]